MALRDAGWRVVNVAVAWGARPAPSGAPELREAAARAGFEARIVRFPSAGDDLVAARARPLEAVGRELEELRPRLVVSPGSARSPPGPRVARRRGPRRRSPLWASGRRAGGCGEVLGQLPQPAW